MLLRCLQKAFRVSYRNNHFNTMFEVCESFSHSMYGASKFMQLMFTLLFQHGGQFYLLVTDQRCLNSSCLLWEKLNVVWDQLSITYLHWSYFYSLRLKLWNAQETSSCCVFIWGKSIPLLRNKIRSCSCSQKSEKFLPDLHNYICREYLWWVWIDNLMV